MARIKMHIPKAKLPFYPPCEVKCRLQNGVSTEGLTIDFLSHFILSFIDTYKDTTTRDKLIFPSAITRIICHASVSYPESAHFTIMGAISDASVRRSEA